ncbi:MAG: GntR family transcriptional regulator [Bacteroides sp.]|nr:GntR family transcriptional regulator [Bacteroides sp.]
MDFKDNKTIYLQIADRICDEILLGRYAEEARIPSVREYAALVEVNANTVMRSYDHLQSREVIYNKRGIGYFVSPGAADLIRSLRRERFLHEEADYFYRQLFTLNVSPEELAGMYRDYIKNQTTTEHPES